MSEMPDGTPEQDRREPRSAALTGLAVLLALEAATAAVVAIVLVADLATARPDSSVSAVGLIGIAAVVAIGLGLMAWHTIAGHAWIRGAAATVQVLMIVVGIGTLQGPGSRPDIGWGLILPAIAVLVLLFSRSVILATSRRGDGSGRTF